MDARFSILLVENEPCISQLMVDFLTKADFSADVVTSAHDALEKVSQSHYDLCFCDIPLSETIDLLSEIHDYDSNIPVMVCSDSTARETAIAAYKAGCDEFVTRPFSMELIILKMKAIIRRSSIARKIQKTVFNFNGIVFDSIKQTLGVQHLSSRENELLLILCNQLGQVVERSYMLKQLWHVDDYFASRSLSVYINRLRRYLAMVPELRIISVHAKGYKLVDGNA